MCVHQHKPAIWHNSVWLATFFKRRTSELRHSSRYCRSSQTNFQCTFVCRAWYLLWSHSCRTDYHSLNCKLFVICWAEHKWYIVLLRVWFQSVLPLVSWNAPLLITCTGTKHSGTPCDYSLGVKIQKNALSPCEEAGRLLILFCHHQMP